jgi:DNA-binding NarL/FixJ family response regulator
LPGTRTRILLADDHPLYRRGLREVLNAEDDLEVVAEADDGVQALELVLREQVDLAILDVLMPRMSGLELAAELARRKAKVRVLMLSSSEGEQHLLEAHRAGAAGYLLKSGAETELADACRAVMRGEQFYPAASAALFRRAETVRETAEILTPRELEVLKLVAEGRSSQRIADELVISINTVDRHRQNLLEKLGLHDRVELARYAIRRGLVEP